MNAKTRSGGPPAADSQRLERKGVTQPGEASLPLADAGTAAPGRPAAPWFAGAARASGLAATLLQGIVLGALVGPWFQGATVPQRTAASAAATPAASVGALGRLMPQDDATTLALPFAAGDARVARILVRAGQRVTTGQVVAELDNLPQRAAQHLRAAAELAARRAAVEQVRSAGRLNLAEAQAGTERAHAARLAADQALVRIRQLAQVGMATRAQLEQSEALATQAAADQAKAMATVRRYAGRDTDAQPEVQLALRDLDVARAALAQAEQELAAARVTATLDGIVIAIHVRVGEKPGDRGVATLGNTDRMAAELEVHQTDIRKVALGQPVVLTAASLDGPLMGTVSQIGLEVNRQSLVAGDPAAAVDARVVRIRVSLDPPSSERCRALTGLQVVGTITTGRP